ncbi:MAG TPA: hypothetical protein VJ698_03620 [Noviherbaspirillum sp.]|uniref:hypothetical protein n=1 Tax=Noviherbaspirillum sp. TaxID=1926288 RepID=UPI002B497D54|nr:hypothetical protein [Noviherbaspirillum sp.]HJV84539.1 hypothetical protein [Noviherbaspirillum sp.]
MESINGILILRPDEKRVIETIIGPITSYRVEDIRLGLINMAERREAEGYLLWGQIIRGVLEKVTAFAGSSSQPESVPVFKDELH